MRERKIISNVVVLSILAFVINLGFGAVMPIIPFLLLYYDGKLPDYPENLGTVSDVGNIAFEITFIMSSFMLTRAFFARKFGKVSDVVGRKIVISFGSLIYAIVSYMFIFSRHWTHLLFLRAIQGIASAMVWPVAEAMLADSVPSEERGRFMGWYMMTSNVSWFASPVIGAFLYKYASSVLHLSVFESLIFPFYFLTLFSFLSFLMSFLTKETIVERKNISLKILLRCVVEEKMELSNDVKVSIRAIYVMGFANGVAMGFVAPIAGIFIIQYITSDPEALGWLSTISGIMGFIVNYPAGRLSDVYGRKKIIVSAQLGTRFLTFIIPFSKTFNDILIIYSLRSIMFNILSPVYRALQADLVPIKIRGRVFGTVQSLFNIGAALAPLGGLIYSRIQHITINIFGFLLPGVAILFWTSATIGLVATIIFALYVVEPRNRIKV